MSKAKKSRVFLTERAIADLQEIETYTTGKWGPSQAAKYLDSFNRAFSLVESEPGVLLPIPQIESLLSHRVGSHLVVVTMWESDVLVLTVVHASRDLLPHLTRLLPTLIFEVDFAKKMLPKV